MDLRPWGTDATAKTDQYDYAEIFHHLLPTSVFAPDVSRILGEATPAGVKRQGDAVGWEEVEGGRWKKIGVAVGRGEPDAEGWPTLASWSDGIHAQRRDRRSWRRAGT